MSLSDHFKMTSLNKDDKMDSELSCKQLISNQEAFLQIRKAELNRLRGIPVEDEKTEPGSETSSNFGFLELRSTHEWSASGSDSSSLPSPPHSDFHIHDSVEAIREEAARIDTIMALDQLDTIKQELSSVKKILKVRRMEIHDLREQLALRDELLSTLELERNLYKGEVAQLKDQLETIQRSDETVTEAQEPMAVHVTAIHGIDNTETLAMIPNIPTAPSVSHPEEVVSSVVRSISPSTHRVLPRPPIPDSTNDDGVVVNQIKGKEENRSCLFVPRALFRKKRRPENHDDNIRELGHLLRASMDTNEELRKRIAMLSAYYETVVERMQGSLNEAHVERQRVATDLAQQIVSMDKHHRRTVEEMERRLCQKERELATCREVQL